MCITITALCNLNCTCKTHRHAYTTDTCMHTHTHTYTHTHTHIHTHNYTHTITHTQSQHTHTNTRIRKYPIDCQRSAKATVYALVHSSRYIFDFSSGVRIYMYVHVCSTLRASVISVHGIAHLFLHGIYIYKMRVVVYCKPGQCTFQWGAVLYPMHACLSAPFNAFKLCCQ